MAIPARTRLIVAAAVLFLSLVPPGHAGTAAAPEVTDADDDRTAQGVIPIGLVPAPFTEPAELVAGWVDENATALFFSIQALGDLEGLAGGPGAIGEPFGFLALYDYEFHFTRGGADLHAAVRISDDMAADGVVPSELATEATISGNVVTLTVPKSTLPGLAPGEALTELELSVVGTITGIPPADVLGTVEDEATGTMPYTVLLADGGTPTDKDGDGLDDAKEVAAFGNLDQTGSGDPDKDGLNNSREFAIGTNANKADTDGDGLNDKADPFPLDPAKPADTDGDGLNDTWERRYFPSLAAQSGSGDPDGDGLTNKQEEKLGTNPTKADTDGGDVNDKADPAPLDPHVGDGSTEEAAGREAEPELYAGSVLFAVAATFILLGLAKGI